MERPKKRKFLSTSFTRRESNEEKKFRYCYEVNNNNTDDEIKIDLNERPLNLNEGDIILGIQGIMFSTSLTCQNMLEDLLQEYVLEEPRKLAYKEQAEVYSKKLMKEMDPPCCFFKARPEETGRNKYIITDMSIKDVTESLKIKIKNKISSHNEKKPR